MNILWILQKKYNRDIKVDFICKCGNTHNKTRMTEWKERINILNQQIQYWIDNKSNKTIEIIELFYDNYL